MWCLEHFLKVLYQNICYSPCWILQDKYFNYLQPTWPKQNILCIRHGKIQKKRPIDVGVGNNKSGLSPLPPCLLSPSLCRTGSQSRHSFPQNAWGWQRMQCYYFLACAGPLSRLPVLGGERVVGLDHRMPRLYTATQSVPRYQTWWSFLSLEDPDTLIWKPQWRWRKNCTTQSSVSLLFVWEQLSGQSKGLNDLKSVRGFCLFLYRVLSFNYLVKILKNWRAS